MKQSNSFPLLNTFPPIPDGILRYDSDPSRDMFFEATRIEHTTAARIAQSSFEAAAVITDSLDELSLSFAFPKSALLLRGGIRAYVEVDCNEHNLGSLVFARDVVGSERLGFRAFDTDRTPLGVVMGYDEWQLHNQTLNSF